MAHYAVLDENNVIIDVITGKDETELYNGEVMDWEQVYSESLGKRCLRTSYNTIAGVHNAGGEPYRKNYAGIGYTYDSDRDAFIPPKPFDSWLLDEDTCTWQAPIPCPDLDYQWDESTLSWKPIE